MAKILACDDTKLYRQLVKDELESEGHEVVTVSRGINCIRKALEIKPDFIFLDVMMPGMDGWETLAELRKYEELKNIPISMLTSEKLSLEEFRSKYDEMEELVAYLYKPFTKEDLLETLKENL